MSNHKLQTRHEDARALMTFARSPLHFYSNFPKKMRWFTIFVMAACVLISLLN